MSSAKRPSFSPLVALSAAVSAFRPGAAAPAAGAPAPGAPEARAASRQQLGRSLRACTWEGLFAEVVTACAGGAVLTGWAIYLEASALVAGLVVALPQMAQLCQLPAAWTTAWMGHRRACVLLVGLARQVTLPLVLLPFLPFSPGVKQAILVGVAALAAVLGVLGNNAWVAWMADLVPRRVRGRYFGRRTALCVAGGALASGAAGLWLDGARAGGLVGPALAALQLVACASGAVTTLLMRRQHDPSPGPAEAPRLAQALVPFRDPAVRGLLVYQLGWNFAVGLSASFFGLFMLRELRMGFSLVALHGAALAAARVLTAPLWGHLVDRVGARPVLVTCSFGLASVPLLWLIPREGTLWPLAIDAVVAGALWCGHGLAIFALPLSVTPRQGRPFYLAATSTVAGIAFTAAAAAGGLLVESLPDRLTLAGRSWHDLQVLFLGSGLLRAGAAVLCLRIVEPSARGVSALWAAMPGAVSRALPPRRRAGASR